MADQSLRIGTSRTRDTSTDSKSTLYCSFCGKSQHEVEKLIAGPTVFICNECIEVSLGIIREGRELGSGEKMSYFILRTRHQEVWDGMGVSAARLLQEAFGLSLDKAALAKMAVPEMLVRLSEAASRLIEAQLNADQINSEIRKAKTALSELGAQASSARQVLHKQEDALKNLKRLQARLRRLRKKPKPE